MQSKFSDAVIARLRTLVPLWWGAFVVWVLAQFPDVGRTLTDFGVDLNDPNVVAGITAGAVIAFTFLWDYIWKRVEHILPAWLTRLVVGSNQTPVYVDTSATGVGGDVDPETVGNGVVPDDSDPAAVPVTNDEAVAEINEPGADDEIPLDDDNSEDSE